MKKFTKKSEFYTNYSVKKRDDSSYKITITCFIGKKYLPMDIKNKYIKTIFCSESELDDAIWEIKNTIVKTRNHIKNSLYNSGFSNANINAFLREHVR